MDRRTLIAATLMAAMGALVFLSLPVLVGLMIDALALSESQAGAIASSYFAAYLIASSSSVFWVHKASLKSLTGTAYLLMAAGLGTGGVMASHAGMLLSMFVAGIGGGMLFSLAVALVTSGQDKDRNYGWLLVVQQLFAAAYLFAMPRWIAPEWGLWGALFCLCALSVLLLPSVFLISTKLEAEYATGAAKPAAEETRLVLAAILLLVIHFAGLSALWAFIERIGVSNQLDPNAIGSALSLSMFGGLAGALLVTQIGDRYGRRAPLWLATAIFIAVCAGLAPSLNWLAFVLLTGALSFAWNFVLAYQMGIISDLDRSGSKAVLIPAAQALGAVLGPLLGGWVLGNLGLASLLTVVAIICTGTITLFSVLVSRIKTR